MANTCSAVIDKDKENVNNPTDCIPRDVLVQQQRSRAPKRRTDLSSLFPSSSPSPASSDPDQAPDSPAGVEILFPSSATPPSTEDLRRMASEDAPTPPSAPCSPSESEDRAPLSHTDLDEQSGQQNIRHRSKKSEVNKTLIFQAKNSEVVRSIDIDTAPLRLICALTAASRAGATDEKKRKNSSKDSKPGKEKPSSSSIKESTKNKEKPLSSSTKVSSKSKADKKPEKRKLDASASQRSGRKRARRLKIMQQLGLAPPAGSTFVLSS